MFPFQLVHEPGNSKCFVDGLLDHQLKNQNMQNEHRLSDDDIFGMTNELIFAGRCFENNIMQIFNKNKQTNTYVYGQSVTIHDFSVFGKYKARNIMILS